MRMRTITPFLLQSPLAEHLQDLSIGSDESPRDTEGAQPEHVRHRFGTGFTLATTQPCSIVPNSPTAACLGVRQGLIYIVQFRTSTFLSLSWTRCS